MSEAGIRLEDGSVQRARRRDILFGPGDIQQGRAQAGIFTESLSHCIALAERLSLLQSCPIELHLLKLGPVEFCLLQFCWVRFRLVDGSLTDFALRIAFGGPELSRGQEACPEGEGKTAGGLGSAKKSLAVVCGLQCSITHVLVPQWDVGA